MAAIAHRPQQKNTHINTYDERKCREDISSRNYLTKTHTKALCVPQIWGMLNLTFPKLEFKGPKSASIT